MNLDIVSCEKSEGGWNVSYEMINKDNEKEKGGFICKHLHNTAIARGIIDILINNESVEKITLSSSELNSKALKIRRLINQFNKQEIRKDGRVIHRNKLINQWTNTFKNQFGVITSGEYEGESFIFKSCNNWTWKGIDLTLILSSKEEINTIGETISFAYPHIQRKWVMREDMVLSHDEIVNKVSAQIGIHNKCINIDEEVERILTDIEDRYGGIAINQITLKSSTKYRLKKEIERKVRVFQQVQRIGGFNI